MMESCSHIGHRRTMNLSQSSAQSASSPSSGTETGTKRIVTAPGFRLRLRPPRSAPEAEPRLLKKVPTERKICLLIYNQARLAGYLRRSTPRRQISNESRHGDWNPTTCVTGLVAVAMGV